METYSSDPSIVKNGFNGRLENREDFRKFIDAIRMNKIEYTDREKAEYSRKFKRLRNFAMTGFVGSIITSATLGILSLVSFYTGLQLIPFNGSEFFMNSLLPIMGGSYATYFSFKNIVPNLLASRKIKKTIRVLEREYNKLEKREKNKEENLSKNRIMDDMEKFKESAKTDSNDIIGNMDIYIRMVVTDILLVSRAKYEGYEVDVQNLYNLATEYLNEKKINPNGNSSSILETNDKFLKVLIEIESHLKEYNNGLKSIETEKQLLDSFQSLDNGGIPTIERFNGGEEKVLKLN